MPGAELQLVLNHTGKSRYFIGNPQVSFFRTVYRRHTNFAMETIQVPFSGSNTLSNLYTTTLRLKVKPLGDLIKDLYLSFEIPDIYSDEISQFQWIHNLGSIIVKRVRFYIGGQMIQDFNGEYIYIMNQLNQPISKDAVFNRITGNEPELYDPKSANPVWNRYPAHSRASPGSNTVLTASERNIGTSPSIRGRRIYLPIPFWFSTNSGNALPLIALQFQEISVEIELRPLIEIYTVRKINPENMSEYGYWNAFDFTPNIDPVWVNNVFGVRQRPVGNQEDDLYAFFINGQKFFDFKIALEARYIYLDIEERNRFKLLPHSYLIRQLDIIENKSTTGDIEILVNLNKPVEQVIMFSRRDDLENNNQWTNFTNFPKEGLDNVTTYYNAYWNNIKYYWDQGYRYIYSELYTTDYLCFGPGINTNSFPGIGRDGQEFIYFNAFAYYAYLMANLGIVFQGSDIYLSKTPNPSTTGIPISALPNDLIRIKGSIFNIRINQLFTYEVFDRFRDIWEFYLPNNIPIIDKTNYKLYDDTIFEKIELYFNGYLRESARDGRFYNTVTQYQSYLRSTDKGIIVYSFAINPNDPQPSGVCPFNDINEVKVRLTLKTPPIIGIPLQPGLNANFLYSYNVNFYLISINVLNIKNGLGGLVYVEA